MSVICRNCGAILRDTDVFCTECGTMVGDEVSPFIDDDVDDYDRTAGVRGDGPSGLICCPECGSMMQPEMDFCTNCGAPLKGGYPDDDYRDAGYRDDGYADDGRYGRDSDHYMDAGGRGPAYDEYRPEEDYPSYPDDYPRVPEADYDDGGDFVGPDYGREPDYGRSSDPGYGSFGGGRSEFSGEWSDPSFAEPPRERVKEAAPAPKPALKGSLVKGFERKKKADEGEYEKSEHFTKAGDL